MTDILLDKLLDKLRKHYKTPSGEKPTHTIMSGGSFLISKEQEEQFLELYTSSIMKGDNPELIEMPLKDDHNIILIDLDIKYKDLNIQEHQYDDDLLLDITKAYQHAIKRYTNIENDEYPESYIFERDKIFHEKNELKDGIHIIFPQYRIPKMILFQLREDVIIELRRDFSKYFSNNLKNNISDVIDRSVIATGNWYMYGSGKQHKGPYKLTKVCDGQSINDFSGGTTEESVRKLIKMFSIRNSEIEKITKGKLSGLGKSYLNIIPPTKPYYTTPFHPIDIDKIPALVSLLLDERAEHYQSWIELGWVLKNIEPDSEEFLEIWKNFSKRSNKYKEWECEEKWYGMKYRADGLKIGTLNTWVQKDNLDGYLDIVFPMNHKFILDKILMEGDKGMIEVYKAYFGDILKCVEPTSSNGYYLFDTKKNIWKKENIYDIGKHLSENMPNIIKRLFRYLKAYKETQDEREKCMKDLNILIKKMYNANYIKSNLYWIKSEFVDENFIEKLDTKIDILSVKGGLIDLRTGILRPRKKEDYISYELDIHYEGIIETPEIDEFISDIMLGNEEVIEFLHKLLGMFITGEVSDNKFVIFWGESSNGKSVLMELMSGIMEGLYFQAPKDLIIGYNKSNKDQANSSLMALENKRLACVDESDKQEKLCEGVVKNLSGCKLITGRNLHEKVRSFIPYFKIVLLTNFKPIISINDGGLERRLVLVPFLARFVDNPQLPHEKKIDRNKAEELLKHKSAFLSWLVKGAIKYYNEGRLENVPELLQSAKEEYYKENDEIGEYLESRCDITDSEARIPVSELYEDYKEYTGDSKISIRLFGNKMTEKGYSSKCFKIDKKNTKCYLGIKLLNIVSAT